MKATQQEAPSEGATTAGGEAAQRPQLSLANIPHLPKHIKVFGYDRAKLVARVLHLGAGKFPLAHLCSFLDDYNAVAAKEDAELWGVIAVSIRTAGMVTGLRKDDHLYTMVERENDEMSARVMGPIVGSMFGPEDPNALAAKIADNDIKLITVTVSNKGYYQTSKGDVDGRNEDLFHDMAMSLNVPFSDLQIPRTIYWYLTKGLSLRKANGGGPLTIASMDNIEANSKALKQSLLQYISKVEPELVQWVEENVAFPVTTIDRITPDVSEPARKQIAEFLGFDASVVVTTERTRQLCIEPSPYALPAWEKVGVEKVEDCAASWQRKFYALNTAHQLVAIPALRLGLAYIHDAMAIPAVAGIVRLGQEGFSTFLPGGLELNTKYGTSVVRRFSDSAIEDSPQRVAARGTSKASERLGSSIERAHAASGKVLLSPTFVMATWLLNLGGTDEHGKKLVLNDPDAEKLQGVHQSVLAWLKVQTDSSKPDTQGLRTIFLKIGEIMRDARYERLAAIDGFVTELAWSLININSLGFEAAGQALLQRAQD